MTVAIVSCPLTSPAYTHTRPVIDAAATLTGTGRRAATVYSASMAPPLLTTGQ